MTQQYQTRMQRITMLLTLLALVIVIAKNVSAGTNYVTAKKVKIEQCSTEVKDRVISLTSEIEDLPWNPVLTFFR
ncbi:MAG: hypothetical protein QM802_23775 [Agriterribacter sp.]